MAGPASGDREDPQVNFLIAVAMIFALYLLITYLLDDEIRIFHGYLAWLVVKPFALLAGLADGSFMAGTFVDQQLLAPAGTAARFLEANDVALMSDEQRDLVMTIAGRCISIIAIPALLAGAFAVRQLRPDERYHTQHTLDTMIREHAENWSAARFARFFNPADQPETDGKEILAEARARRDAAAARQDEAPSRLLAPAPEAVRPPTWGRSMRPEEWLDAHGIAWRDDACDSEAVMSALSDQLQRPWKGLEALELHERALVAVFALFNAYKREAAEALVDDLAVLFAERGLKNGMTRAIREETGLVARIDATLASEDAAPLVKVAERHAWVETAMIGMFVESRRAKGILASARFLWLKTVDRTMWYALNNAGGNAMMIEAAGISAHYKAEMQFGFPLRQPFVGQAAKALLLDYLDLADDRVKRRAERRAREGRLADDVLADIRLAAESAQAAEAAEAAGKG
jgi:intracellular multiplication protein IcmP